MSERSPVGRRAAAVAPNDRLRAAACPTCEATDGLAVHPDRGQVRAPGGVLVPYETAYTACARCGQEFLTREQTRADGRAASAAVREHAGLLSGDEIRGMRRSFGVTQEQFERALRLGPKTVVRWETGRVNQSRSADLLLRSLRADPASFSSLARDAGVLPSPINAHSSVTVCRVAELSGVTFFAAMPFSSYNTLVATGSVQFHTADTEGAVEFHAHRVNQLASSNVTIPDVSNASDGLLSREGHSAPLGSASVAARRALALIPRAA